MQRIVNRFALVYLALTTVACMDQGRYDQTATEIEAVRRDTAREARLQALEREHAFLMQQITTLSTSNHPSFTQTSAKEDARDKRLADLSMQIAALSQMLTTWREEERPLPINPEAHRIAEQVSAADGAAAISRVQALIDAGRIKLTMRGGRIQIAPVRPIDATNPYEPPPAKPGAPQAPPPPAPKRPIDPWGY